jgi:acetyltransferase-like isoleucine patch superfamily enzyme
VEIGAECLLGANVMIVDTDFHPLAAEGRRHNHHPACIGTAEVVLERNVFVGANSIILKGVRIGENSVIGAGSVVARDVPANSIAAGNPCRLLRPLTPQRGGEV